MTEIDQITEDLKTENSPIVLVDYLTKLAGWGSYYEGLLKPISMWKPKKWLEIQNLEITADPEYRDKTTIVERIKPLSDKKTEMVWLTTEDGQKEIEYTSELKRIDRLTRAIRQNLWAKKIEYRNLSESV